MLVSLPSKENRRWFIRIATPHFYESKANNIAYGLVKDVHTMSYPQISHNPQFLPPWSPDFFPYHHLFGWTPQNRDVPCELPGNHQFFMVLQFYGVFSTVFPCFFPFGTTPPHFGRTTAISAWPPSPWRLNAAPQGAPRISPQRGLKSLGKEWEYNDWLVVYDQIMDVLWIFHG